MSRVKKAIHAVKYRRKLLKKVKGYRYARSKKERAAFEAFVHAGKYAFAHRRDRKADFRKRWNIRLNAALRAQNLNYSRFIHALKKKNVILNRKVLSTIANDHPETFARILAAVS